jgi:hypothetical protein
MMGATISFVAAALLTLLFSAVIVAVLWRSLLAILIDLCGTQTRARYWCCYSSIVFFLVPLCAVLLGRTTAANSEPFLFQVADQLRWGMLGLIAALVVVSVCLSAYIKERIVTDRKTDLDRLSTKMEQLRSK